MKKEGFSGKETNEKPPYIYGSLRKPVSLCRLVLRQRHRDAQGCTGMRRAAQGFAGSSQQRQWSQEQRRKLQLEAHATGLDTGCCYGGALTGVFLPSRELVSVPARRTYAEARG